jgi:hypothetical protein
MSQEGLEAMTIFDDGQLPVTCCRELTEGKFCEYLKPNKHGTIWYCEMFGKYKEELQFHGKDLKNLLKPHEDCLKARD